MPDITDRVLIDLPYHRFERMVLAALEKDTGAVQIVPEIWRLCKVAMHKRAVQDQWIKNLRGKK